MSMAINLIRLDVIENLNEAGLAAAKTVSKTYSYAQRAFYCQEKTWGNLIQRIGDALYHIFCQKVIVRVSNTLTGGWENQTFWVKGEQIAKSRLFLEDPSLRPFSESNVSEETLASNPGSPSSPSGLLIRAFSSSSFFQVNPEPSFALFPQKDLAQKRLKIAEEAVRAAMRENTDPLGISEDLWIALRKAKAEFDAINQKYNQALVTEKKGAISF